MCATLTAPGTLLILPPTTYRKPLPPYCAIRYKSANFPFQLSNGRPKFSAVRSRVVLRHVFIMTLSMLRTSVWAPSSYAQTYVNYVNVSQCSTCSVMDRTWVMNVRNTLLPLVRSASHQTITSALGGITPLLMQHLG